MPRVSVILPNYNYARYLKERIRSILGQTEADFELLYLDDASTDNSNAVVEEFTSDPRLRLYCYAENSGSVYSRRNASVEMAQGEWIWFAEADDSAHPRFLERMLALAEERPTAGILHCRMVTMDAIGRIVGVRWSAEPALAMHLEQDYFAPGHEDAVRLTAGCFYSSSSGMLLRRDSILECGGYDARLKSAADWDLYLRMLQRHDVAYSAEALAYYRSHSASVTKTTGNTTRAIEDAYCVASAYRWINTDARVSHLDRAMVLQRLKARIFDITATSHEPWPANMQFAVDAVRACVPDARLPLH